MNAATASQATSPQQATPAPAASPTQPFVRGAVEHEEPMGFDVSNALGGSQVLLGLFDVPAFGYMRSLVITVTATGGTGTAAVYKEDAPWSVLSEITLNDVNGAPIVGPISGWDLYAIHKWGAGTAGNPDPTRNPNYVAPGTDGNFAFQLRVPVEVSSRDAYCSLPNMNAASTFKLRLTQAAKSDVYSTDPTGLPTIRVTAHLEAWSQPAATDLLGRPNAQTPPGMGSSSFWSKQVFNLASGANIVRSQRVGNLLRSSILVFRTSGTARSNANFPDPLSLFVDSKLIFNRSRGLSRMKDAEKSLVTTLDTGVVVLDHCHDWDGLLGGEMRDQWMVTGGGTRWELNGSWGAAGTLTILTNDVAPVGDPYLG